MRTFLNNLVDVKDSLQPIIAPPAIVTDVPDAVEEESGPMSGSMAIYYQQNVELNRPTIQAVPLSLKTDMSYKLKFQAVVLSLVDIHTIVQTVTNHRAFFVSANFTNIMKLADKIKRAFADDLTLTDVYPGVQLQYVMFIQEYMPPDMESNYITQLHTSMAPGRRDERGLPYRVKDVVRRMLFAVDSFAPFVSRSATCSLEDIANFLVDFSYLYKHNTDKKGVQLELLARFLKTHMVKLPEEYQVGNYRKLFNELYLEYKRKHTLKRMTAERNLQMLLMAMHIMEKHISDIRSEEKVVSAFKRSSDFFAFILKEKISVSIRRVKNSDGVKVLKIGKPQNFTQSNVLDVTSTVHTVLDFTKEFCTFEEVQRATEHEEDIGYARGAFLQYLTIVHKKLEEHPQYAKRTSEEINEVFEDIVKYMTRRMNKEIFPPWASKADLVLYNSTLSLNWVTPDDLMLDLTVPNLMIQEAAQKMREIDGYLSPQSKLSCMMEAVSLVLNEAEFGATLDNLEQPEGTLPYLMYLLIIAQPNRFWSSMNFIAKFWHPRQTEKQPWLCFSLMKSAARLIDAVDETTFRLPRSVYLRKLEDSKKKRS